MKKTFLTWFLLIIFLFILTIPKISLADVWCNEPKCIPCDQYDPECIGGTEGRKCSYSLVECRNIPGYTAYCRKTVLPCKYYILDEFFEQICYGEMCSYTNYPPNIPVLIAPPHNRWINYDPVFEAQISDPDNDNIFCQLKVLTKKMGEV